MSREHVFNMRQVDEKKTRKTNKLKTVVKIPISQFEHLRFSIKYGA